MIRFLRMKLIQNIVDITEKNHGSIIIMPSVVYLFLVLICRQMMKYLL